MLFACLLLAQSGHCAAEFQCPLLGVKRTWFVSECRVSTLTRLQRSTNVGHNAPGCWEANERKKGESHQHTPTQWQVWDTAKFEPSKRLRVLPKRNTLAHCYGLKWAYKRRHFGVIMKWRARSEVGSARPSHSEGEWDRWFAWYPVTIATSRFSAHWVWLDFVERKWSTCIYGSGRKNGAIGCLKKKSTCDCAT